MRTWCSPSLAGSIKAHGLPARRRLVDMSPPAVLEERARQADKERRIAEEKEAEEERKRRREEEQARRAVPRSIHIMSPSPRAPLLMGQEVSVEWTFTGAVEAVDICIELAYSSDPNMRYLPGEQFDLPGNDFLGGKKSVLARKGHTYQRVKHDLTAPEGTVYQCSIKLPDRDERWGSAVYDYEGLAFYPPSGSGLEFEERSL